MHRCCRRAPMCICGPYVVCMACWHGWLGAADLIRRLIFQQNWHCHCAGPDPFAKYTLSSDNVLQTWTCQTSNLPMTGSRQCSCDIDTTTASQTISEGAQGLVKRFRIPNHCTSQTCSTSKVWLYVLAEGCSIF